MTQITVHDLNSYLISLANHNAGIRRKLLNLKKYIEEVTKCNSIKTK